MGAVKLDGEALFGDGPAEVVAGGLSLRRAEHEAPGGDGVRVIGQGRGGRTIVQQGELVADTAQELQGMVSAIEVKLDGQPHVLTDERGTTWADVVMLTFEPKAIRRAGTRVVASYRVEYVQVS